MAIIVMVSYHIIKLKNIKVYFGGDEGNGRMTLSKVKSTKQ